MSLQIASFRQIHEQRHTLGLYCMFCDRWSEANLHELIARGLGERLLIESNFSCRECGGRAAKQLRPPVPGTGGAVAYIVMA